MTSTVIKGEAKVMPSLGTTSLLVVDDDTEDERNENLTRDSSTNTKPQQQSKIMRNHMRKTLSMPSSLGNSNHNQKSISSRSNTFKINCSQIPIVETEESNNEQTETRRRRLEFEQQRQEQAQNMVDAWESSKVLSPINSKKQVLHDLGQQTNDQEQKRRWQSSQSVPLFDEQDGDNTVGKCDYNINENESLTTTPHLVNDNEGNSRDNDKCNNENESCCTLQDSAMSFNIDYTDHIDCTDHINLTDHTNNDTHADDASIATTKIGSGIIMDDSSTSMSLNSFNSKSMRSSHDDVRSIASSLSRGEAHINSRMKKYGLANINDMKRKKQKNRNNIRINSNHAVSVNSGLTENTVHYVEPSDVPTKIRTAPLHVQMAVEEIQRWLFTEGGHFRDVETLMTQYSLYVREHFGIPLDRMFCGGIGLHPKLTAYIWKWEVNEPFSFTEIPTHIFERRNEIFGADEPFCVLEQGRAEYIRIRHTDSYIPPDTEKWFRSRNYKDYFALPDIHRGVSKGGLAWSTKFPDGFGDDDIQFFRMTHAALTNILRLHTNDLVLNTLTDRMEREIEERTEELAIANRKMEERTNELAVANCKLEEANEEISRHASKQLEHFACMSHEIRTPLNCIVGLSSLLLESEDLNEDVLDTIKMVNNSADLVQGVVNDVLDYAKIESGHFELDIRASDLQNTLNGVVHSISNKLQDKNVEIRTSYCGKLGKSMTTDGRRLQQILYNILGNAAKFSREGTTIDFKAQVLPVVSADTVTGGKNKRKIRFSIKDYGKGIEEKNFKKIFQPFSQASKETQTVYGGTGLGLSITKNLVTRLEGSISINSEIDKFTEFIVDLPYEEELVDNTKYKEKISGTCIIILDPIADAPITENDAFVPLPTDVIEQYDLNVMRCSSWEELEGKLETRADSEEKYVILVHTDIENRQGIFKVEKLVHRQRCTWFTFGSHISLHQQRQHYFKTLTGTFPSILIDKISEAMVAQHEDGNSISSVSSSESKALTKEEEDKHSTDDQRQSESREVCYSGMEIIKCDNPSLSPSSIKDKKRYSPRELKVLIVDDNIVNQKVLDRILKRLGVNDTSIVNNGKKAVDLTANTHFDCIFMDMEMPVMGGLEACRQIVLRDKEAARVAFVTAHDIEDIRKKADMAGAYCYISKPLKMKDIDEFLAKIELSIKQYPQELPKRMSAAGAVASPKKCSTPKKADERKAAASPNKRPTPQKMKRSTKQYPPRNLKVLVAEDNLINQKVLDRILKRLGVSEVTIVDNGKKAVDASEATMFDCILMDMQMPVMDGVEATKIIVERDRELKVDGPKIVFVTAHALVEFREKAMEAGAFDFITKPFKMQDIDKILTILEPIKLDSQACSGNSTMQQSSPQMMEGSSDEQDTSDKSCCLSGDSSHSKPKKMAKLNHNSSAD